mmetsp:Transcript_9121/g.11240  ORF Transcript_9121/g.11240 Transcript_9121/m.11240 type:complete len:429 (+) Transcript_9121:141-1427(+)|eukprot:CAMPEP_0172511152 /NCGR_PEP_ID=MMETSP1066-20121228/234196_1 /TAXON_ID=671091 /ORGANISM="Coscinodiscus wailesii, Strain CCMP2513" /LENGTH=428 /DNA_ID=CAMNT_0013290415 /DNA_START=129 /DNA_END=1415 /DNA_ORIENTATION=+
MRINPLSLAFLLFTPVTAFTPTLQKRSSFGLYSTSTEPTTDSSFAAFAETLEEDEIFEENEKLSTWKESLDEFLDPLTPLAKKQILLSDLVNSNDEIQKSLEEAIRERKIDPILTPTAQKLQSGTRAVARQITSDIIPSLQEIPSKTPPPTIEELPTLVPKITSRIFDAVSTQARKNLNLLAQDLSNPTRIPERLTKQTNELIRESKNVFRETPEGLVGPPYTVVFRGEGYELRDYEGYDAAATSMSKLDEEFTMDDVASSGAAFNALAAYIFGANANQKSLDMTTPVVTTSMGEMRFYLRRDDQDEELPIPLAAEKQKYGERMEVSLISVPPTRLAVVTFPGFTTEGEVQRQKDALLASLAADGIEIDVPHGKPVPHVVLQYNPPYTIPIVRRNEVAVPVRVVAAEGEESLVEEWKEEDDLAPSDVE